MALKYKELMAMSNEELDNKAVELKQELSKERATIASGTRAENPGKIRKIRRDIARILTAISAKKNATGEVKVKIKAEKKTEAVKKNARN